MGLFSKAKKAEVLRKDLKKKMNNEKRVVSEWNKQPTSTATDKKYSKKHQKAEKKSDAAYKKYYNHVHGNFNKQQIAKAKGDKGKFISRSFTKSLETQTARRK